MKISVALCTYNGGKYITPQLESILGQSRIPDEILICDDGSKDNTVAEILKFDHLAIRLMQNPANLGLVKNFEQAIRLTTGDVIFLCDQDDVWQPEKVSKMVAAFEADPAVSMVYADFAFVDQQLQPQTVSLFRGDMYQKSIPRQPHKIIQTWGMIFGCTMAIRATLKPLILPIPAGWGHDAWIGVLAYVFGEVKLIPEALMRYRLHQGSSSGNMKHNVSAAQELAITVGMSKLKFYTDERIRWQNLYLHLKEIEASPHLSIEQKTFLTAFLPEAKRRSDLATLREGFRQGRHVQRLLPSLRTLMRGDYHRYMRGWKTFAKDIFVP